MKPSALLLLILICAGPARAAAFAEQIKKLDDPVVLNEVVKAGDAALADLSAELSGARADLAVQALGRMKLKSAIPVLLPLLKSKDGELRAGAAWAIGQCGGEQAAEALIGILDDAYPRVRSAAVGALGFKSATSDTALRRALSDRDESVRMSAIQSMRTHARGDLFSILLPSLQFHIEKVTQKADGQTEAKEIEKLIWSEPVSQIRLAAIQTLSELKASDGMPALIAALEREASFNRLAIIKAIEGMGPSAAGACLGRIVPLPYDKESFAKHMPVLINNGALAVIAGRLGDERCVPTLLETLKLPRATLGQDKDLTELYIQSAELLGKYKCDRAGRPLAELLKEARVKQLSEAVQKAISEIGRPAARPLARNMDDWSLAPIFLKLLRQPELRTPVARDGILKFLSHESDEVRLEATETLGLYLMNGILDEYDAPLLDAMYLDPNREVRAACKRWQDQLAKKWGSEVAP